MVQSLTVPPLTFHIWVFYCKSCLICPISSNWRNEGKAEPWIKNKMTTRSEFKLQDFDHVLCHFHSQQPKPKLGQCWCLRGRRRGGLGTPRWQSLILNVLNLGREEALSGAASVSLVTCGLHFSSTQHPGLCLPNLISMIMDGILPCKIKKAYKCYVVQSKFERKSCFCLSFFL